MSERFEVMMNEETGKWCIKDNEKLPNLLDNYKACVRLNEFNDKLADLEAKLAESEEKLKSSWYEICHRCGNPYGASQFVRENGEVICSNCMKIEDIYEPLVEQLKQQLAEKEQQYKENVEEILHYRDRVILEHNQDKISFCVKQLEKVKEEFISEVWDLYDTADLLEQVCELRNKQIKFIDNQIKQLKEKNNAD